MDAIALIMVGFGAFLMLEAYHNTNPTPLKSAQTAITTGRPVSTKG